MEQLVRSPSSPTFTSSPGFNNKNDVQIRARRIRTLLHYSQAIYHHRTLLPPGFVPESYQLAPLDFLQTGWFEDVWKEGDEGPKHPRCNMLLCDEGGMGKTLSCAIIALQELYENPEKSVVVVAPKLMINHWIDMFKWTPFPCQVARGSLLMMTQLPPGVSVLSKHALLNHDAHHRLDQLDGNISLLILDEAHEGFLVDKDRENDEQAASPGALVESLMRLFEKADRKIFATATPMREGWKDLLKLCKVLDGEFGEVEEGQPNFFDDRMNDEWFGQLKSTWLPTLEKIRNNNHEEKDVEVLLNHLQHFIPLSPDDLNELRGKIPQRGDDRWEDEGFRARLCRDLHPLGKVLNVTLRDDLGANACGLLFRKKFKSTFLYSPISRDDVGATLGKHAPNNWPTVFASCPMNLLSDSLKIGEYVKKANLKPQLEHHLKRAWLDDPRIVKLVEIVEHALASDSECMRGVVLFSRFVETNRQLREILEIKFPNQVEVFLFHPPDDDERDSRIRDAGRAKFRAQQGDKLPIILSGSSGAVGQNMEWATHVVHWDATKSPAMIEQKNWRLDRRLPTHNEVVSPTFTVHHFVPESDVQASIIAVNERFLQQRLLLGDRRAWNKELERPFIPLSPDVVGYPYSDTAKNHPLHGKTAQWLHDFSNGETSDALSLTAESMVWRAVQEATGFNALEHTKNSDADDAFNPVSTTQTNFHENPDVISGELEERRQLLHRMMRLTPNLAEQTALGRFAGGDDTEASIVFQSGNQILHQKKPALMPTPTGPLMQRFAQIFLDATEEDDERIHPFCVHVDDLQTDIQPCRWYLHLGIHTVNMSSVGATVKSVRGEQHYCGLVRVSNDGGQQRVKLLKIEDLINNGEYSEVAGLMEKLSSVNTYPYVPPPADEVMVQDFEAMNSQPDIDDYPGLFIDAGTASDVRRRLSSERWEELTDLYQDGSYPFNLERDNLLLPLVIIHDTEDDEELIQDLCPMCRKADCSGDVYVCCHPFTDEKHGREFGWEATKFHDDSHGKTGWQ